MVSEYAFSLCDLILEDGNNAKRHNECYQRQDEIGGLLFMWHYHYKL